MVGTRKSQKTKTGGRSGVAIDQIDDSNDDVSGWFDSARSPQAASQQNGASSSNKERGVGDERGQRTKGLSKRKAPKTPKEHVDMSLRGSAENDEMKEQSDHSTNAKKYVSKITRKGTSEFTSPSDLSRVATAPLSPAEKAGNIQTDPKSNDGIESETENVLMTQEGETSFAARQSTNLMTPNVATAETEADFGAADDEDTGDDLGPPVLPQDFSSDEQTQGQPLETNKTNQKNAEKTDFSSSSVDNNYSNDDNKYDDDDDDGDEGPGFNMVHDPETPLTVREERVRNEMEKLREERKTLNRENGVESESDDDEDNKSAQVKQRKKQKKKKQRTVIFSPKGVPIANRDYETVPIGEFIEDDSQDEHGSRRSKRARIKPLEFWRGEKLEFGAHNEYGFIGKALGDMPVVTGIQKALPTPYKKRKPAKKKSDSNKNSKNNDVLKAGSRTADKEFNSKKLRRKYKFHDGEEAYLWDDITEDTADQKVVAYASNMEGSDLPISKKRKMTEGNVTGKAAQAFNISSDHEDYVGYIMGNLLLPPKGIKDSESVGPCAQTFTVCGSQPKALEVAFGDPDQPDGELVDETAQRFLLGPGDMFRVPPGNSYRLENHSNTSECLLTWTIIRPRSVPTESS